MERLWQIVEREGIHVRYVDFRPVGPYVLGAYLNHPRAGPIIMLNERLPAWPRLERCVLAEEIGHHYYPPRPGHIRYHTHPWRDDNQAIIVAQDERLALAWATEHLMPSVEFWRAVQNGYTTFEQLADYFYVTEWFVRAKMRHLRGQARRMGYKIRWKDIIAGNVEREVMAWLS